MRIIVFFSAFAFFSHGQSIGAYDYDCEYYSTETDWESADTAKSVCVHSWLYAEMQDVNEIKPYVNAVYCPCGCGHNEIQARVCSKCRRHETRIVTWGYRVVKKAVSPYKKLMLQTDTIILKKNH